MQRNKWNKEVLTYAFLHDGCSVILVVFLLRARRGGAKLQATAHL